MTFEVVTSLRHSGFVDPSEHVVIRLSEGRWRNLVCSVSHWNDSRMKRLLLVRSAWPQIVHHEAEALLEHVARLGRPTTLDEINAWVGSPDMQLHVGDPAPSVHIIRGFSLDQRKLTLDGTIDSFRL